MASIHVRISGQVSDIQQRDRIVRKIEDALVPLGAGRLRASIWCVLEKDGGIGKTERGAAQSNELYRDSAPRDALVERALELLHADPLRPWSLGMISAEAGASRSALAKRFAGAMGCPPMQYLKRLRMLIAAERLGETNVKIAAVAEAAGYESEAAFSRAFKRFAGCAPGQWRYARSHHQASGPGAERGGRLQVWTIEQENASNDHSPVRAFRISSRLPSDFCLGTHKETLNDYCIHFRQAGRPRSRRHERRRHAQAAGHHPGGRRPARAR
jgi:AraC-like DNA-binding protein